MTETPHIRAHELSKGYRMGAHRVRALDGVGFEVRRGEFVALLGKSGSGKSTLLNLMGALDQPSAGRLEVDGHAIGAMNAGQRARYRRRTVGMIFQSFNLIARRNALSNVALPLEFDGIARAERLERAHLALAQVGLEERGEHKPAELSGGEQQRVAIARALIHSPGLLLADEPTGNLDSATARQIMAILAGKNRMLRLTVVLVTHDAHLARQYAARILRLQDGRLVSDEANTPQYEPESAALAADIVAAPAAEGSGPA